MTEEKLRFIEAFTTQFLANWAAPNYPEACLGGRVKRFAQLAPIEDAFCVADVMYRKWGEELEYADG